MEGTIGIPHKEWHERQMQDPAFRAEYERLGPAFEVAKLRMQCGLTQQQLAERVGTKQSSIARLESGRGEPSLSFLRRVVEALGGRLEIRIVAEAEQTAPAPQRDQARQTLGTDRLMTEKTMPVAHSGRNTTDTAPAGATT